MNRTLDPAELSALLTPKPKKKEPAQRALVPPAPGPIQLGDKELTCLNSGYWSINEKGERYYKKTQGRCGSSTYYTLEGVPYCMTHIISRANMMLHELM